MVLAAALARIVVALRVMRHGADTLCDPATQALKTNAAIPLARIVPSNMCPALLPIQRLDPLVGFTSINDIAAALGSSGPFQSSSTVHSTNGIQPTNDYLPALLGLVSIPDTQLAVFKSIHWSLFKSHVPLLCTPFMAFALILALIVTVYRLRRSLAAERCGNKLLIQSYTGQISQLQQGLAIARADVAREQEANQYATNAVLEKDAELANVQLEINSLQRENMLLRVSEREAETFKFLLEVTSASKTAADNNATKVQQSMRLTIDGLRSTISSQKAMFDTFKACMKKGPFFTEAEERHDNRNNTILRMIEDDPIMRPLRTLEPASRFITSWERSDILECANDYQLSYYQRTRDNTLATYPLPETSAPKTSQVARWLPLKLGRNRSSLAEGVYQVQECSSSRLDNDLSVQYFSQSNLWKENSSVTVRPLSSSTRSPTNTTKEIQRSIKLEPASREKPTSAAEHPPLPAATSSYAKPPPERAALRELNTSFSAETQIG